MSSNPRAVISVEEVSKRYLLPQTQAKRQNHETALAALTAKLRGRSSLPSADDSFYALKNITFDVEAGDRIGVIGKNGAGKSTLLKLFSRVTFPTTGRVTTRGRVASLLEVGTGFHPELSGRENVFLNGSLLGLRRHQIRERFDDIVEFAEVGKFIDMPVKRYSSGMYVRLAFAVAAHLDPDILILDEILAVGDTRFQKKCLSRIGELEESGKTIVFVGHSLSTVLSFCTKCVYLKEGQLIDYGPSHSVINRYLSEGVALGTDRVYSREASKFANSTAMLRRIRLIDRQRNQISVPPIQETIGIEMTFDLFKSNALVVPVVHVIDSSGAHVCVLSEELARAKARYSEPGQYRSTVWIPAHTLNNVRYRIGAALVSPDPVETHFLDPDALEFEASDDLNVDSYSGPIPGVIRPYFPWDVERLPSSVQSGRPCEL